MSHHDFEKSGRDHTATEQSVEPVITAAEVHPAPLNVLPTAPVEVSPKRLPAAIAFIPSPIRKVGLAIWKFLGFIGPGFMVAVAYIDPGNYSTDVSAGASTRFGLLFIVLLSNIMACVLQSMAIRLGTVTGMDLAQMCRAHLPWWLNWFLYIFAEAAIIATDIAEVIGSAIALNLLGNVPLVAGCVITIAEVLVILVFYRPNGDVRGLKLFEYGMVGLVLGVVICFCIQLSTIDNATVGEVFFGYVPTSAVIRGDGIYLSAGIVGATVMPHSLYLGSGVCKPRVKAYDDKLAIEAELARRAHIARNASVTTLDSSPAYGKNTIEAQTKANEVGGGATLTMTKSVDSQTQSAPPTPTIITAHGSLDDGTYKPSLAAIKHCLNTSTVELVISLCIFALFVNSAILIVAGASLYGNDAASSADLFGIYDLLSDTISRGAGTVFAVALLLSGLSAGIVCTIAGQLVSEGAINWTIRPWLRQLITRVISIIPSVVIAAAVGREGLNNALNGTQVALSVILPFVSAPLIYFTSRSKYMTVGGGVSPGAKMDAANQGEDGAQAEEKPIVLTNHWAVVILATLIWGLLCVMNVALLVFAGMGED